ncbi:TetR/AcrR family transcriptional regulator [Actinoplanes sp. TBRC 11911]|uniref:TetR/AcrR family transcriptional regulator n=1 Tax=Actinoplanes sp. TBRC 11911 TaxID=2729386 RepID=UPI00145D2059|nr:TetR/AcrR family transcriptional regulator [Actinoplanes sp. TBRC 11911]NMO52899.1 TetR/AcrR family transcriptional regulator [Actinoplanes sp. TBRC 11911]
MAPGVDHRRTDTRDRILSVALGLFTRQGYATTSLREIADELGVTKAALYFHYKTKDDIMAGILRGYLDGLDALVGDDAPDTSALAGREELLRRFAGYQAGWGTNLTRLIRENITEISNLPVGEELRTTHRRLLDVLAGPDPTILDKTRARTALAAIQTVAVSAEHDDASEDELRQAALTVGLEVLRGGR